MIYSSFNVSVPHDRISLLNAYDAFLDVWIVSSQPIVWPNASAYYRFWHPYPYLCIQEARWINSKTTVVFNHYTFIYQCLQAISPKKSGSGPQKRRLTQRPQSGRNTISTSIPTSQSHSQSQSRHRKLTSMNQTSAYSYHDAKDEVVHVSIDVMFGIDCLSSNGKRWSFHVLLLFNCSHVHHKSLSL